MNRKIFINMVPDEFPADWSFQEIGLYSLISSLDNELSQGCFMAIKAMARLIRCSEDTIKRMLKKFEADGIIKITHRPGDTNIINICEQGTDEAESEPAPAPTPPKKPKSEKKHADFTIPDTRFKECWERWLKYKSERREFYVATGISATWKKLMRLSGNDPAVAHSVVEQSIENGWTGLFEVKQKRFNNSGFMRGEVPL